MVEGGGGSKALALAMTVPVASGNSINNPQITGLFSGQGGGTVPGPLGAPRLVVAHGGETITTQGNSPKGGGGSSGGVTVLQVNLDGRQLWRGILPHARSDERSRQGGGV